METKYQHGSESLGFYFCVIYARLGPEEVGYPKIPTDAEEESPNRSFLSLAIGPEKGQPRKTEDF